jgi:hypothetical protein
LTWPMGSGVVTEGSHGWYVLSLYKHNLSIKDAPVDDRWMRNLNSNYLLPVVHWPLRAAPIDHAHFWVAWHNLPLDCWWSVLDWLCLRSSVWGWVRANLLDGLGPWAPLEVPICRVQPETSLHLFLTCPLVMSCKQNGRDNARRVLLVMAKIHMYRLTHQ